MSSNAWWTGDTPGHPHPDDRADSGAPARPAAGKNYAVGVTSPPPPDATAELHIEGMHCSSCVALIEESLTEQAGVAEAVVDLEASRAVVRYDPRLIGPDALLATVVAAGYPATPVG
jgi:copper chaperone CopZ